MSNFRLIASTLFLMIFAVWSTQAQSQCDLDVEDIIARVATDCENIDANQVCYGNRNVTATAQDNVDAFEFNAPGDLVSLSSIQSLIVDSVDAQQDTWGVAQMRLLVGSGQGVQDINMLLFGEFDVRNAIEASDTIALQVQVRQKSLYSRPDLQSEVLDTVESGAPLTGLERLEDSSWLRVENPLTGIVGWTENAGVVLVNEAQSIGILRVQEASKPYFGAMQAFYFENGESDIGCDNVESDGLIIQTPEGQARVSLLINEVSVELVSAFNRAGETESGRAFIQADPASAQGMSVNVLGGAATVQTSADSEPVSVEAGQQTSIPISVNLDRPGIIIPSGMPQNPVSFDASSVSVAPLLPAVTNVRRGGSTPGNTSVSVVTNITGSNSSSGSGNVSINIGGGSGSSSSSTTGGDSTSGSSSGGSSSTGGSSSNGSSIFSSGGSTSGGNTGTGNVSGSSSSSSTGSSSQTSSTRAGIDFGAQGNVIAATLAVLGALLVLGFIIWSAKQRD